MDLPKGLVGDDERIHAELAKLTTIPLDAVMQFWKVYTTTNKQLYDPTARRLENFWWHVWGSDRRNLRPETIAAIWHHISFGQSFVPLKGSPNRYEPPIETSRSKSQHESDAGERTSPRYVPEPSKVLEQATMKELSASSSRPPPSHPILKKSRGDSKSGPRPTARFASPLGSGNEGEGQLDESSSESIASVGGLDMRMNSNSATARAKSGKKKPTSPGKKFVAHGATTKRRPFLPRRQSSQSSTGSDIGYKAGPSPAGSRHSGSQQDTPTLAADRPSPQMTPELQTTQTTSLSAKAQGKQPVTSGTSPANTGRQQFRPTNPEQPKSTNARDTNQATSPLHEQGSYRLQQPTPSLATEAGTAISHRKSTSLGGETKHSRTASQTEQQRPRQASLSRASSYGLLSNATASTSNIAATGQLSKITDEPNVGALQATGAFSPDEEPTSARGTTSSIPRNSSTASLMMPTVPSPTPSVPLARSRSQLTLLLEREKERGMGSKGRRQSREQS